MNRSKLTICSCVLAIFLIGVLPGAERGRASSTVPCGNWHFVPSPSPGAGFKKILNGVTSIAARDVWTVGYNYNRQALAQTLTEHWNGTKWNVIPSPNTGSKGDLLNGVASISGKDVWAVGSSDGNTTVQTLTEHWDGARWSIISSPNPGSSDNDLNGVATVSGNDVWAVGTYSNGGTNPPRTLIEHWNGTSWTIISSPNAGSKTSVLTGIVVLSADDIWAVGLAYQNGHSQSYQTLIEHWNGIKWSIVPSPNVKSSNDILMGVTAISATNVWAVGNYYKSDPRTARTLIEHWDGARWSVISSPNPGNGFNVLNGVAAVSASSIWAAGEDQNNNSNQTLIEHWDGTSWNGVPSPNPGPSSNYLNAITRVLGTSNAWAVGSYLNRQNTSYNTLTEFYCS